MTRRLPRALLVALLLVPGAAGAQGAPAAPPASAAPPAAAAPPAHAAPAEAEPEDPHAAANPHAAPGQPSVPRDESEPAADLPPGSVEAVILDENRVPVVRTQVRLGIMFSKISEGESRSERFATTDAQGRVRFDGLSFASEYSYRITVKRATAEYGSLPFSLGDKFGHRVALHVFPVTNRLAEAPVGVRGIVYIEPRDDVIQFEVMFRIFNIGAVTWVPDDVVVKIPAGFKAFGAQKGMTGVGFVAAGEEGARLEGTFSPGQHDATFRFQMPKSGSDTASFELDVLPRVVELRVIAEASSKMSVSVSGWDSPEPAANTQGKRVLVSQKSFPPSDQAPSPVAITLSGLPTPGPGRWIASMIAAAFGALGFAAYRGVVRLDATDSQRKNQDLESARELLLGELVDVERAHRSGDLGPRAYSDARRTLLEALSRLGREVLSPGKKKRRPVAA